MNHFEAEPVSSDTHHFESEPVSSDTHHFEAKLVPRIRINLRRIWFLVCVRYLRIIFRGIRFLGYVPTHHFEADPVPRIGNDYFQMDPVPQIRIILKWMRFLRYR